MKRLFSGFIELEKIIKVYIIASIVVILIYIGYLIWLYNTNKISIIFSGKTERIEWAYFEGQKDTLEGDIRIKKDNNGCYRWVRSPWDSGSYPSFDPSLICE